MRNNMKATAKRQQVFLAIFVIVASLASTVQSGEITVLPDVLYYNVTTTPRAELFAIHNQRQFTAHIKMLEQQLHEFNDNFNARLDTVAHHSELLELKLHEMDNWLNPLVLLDDVNDYCVQKYRVKLPALATLKNSLAACRQKGTSAYAGIVSGADATLKNLRTYYTTTVTNSMNDCKKKQPKLDEAYVKCVTTVFKNALTTGANNMNTFQNQMKAAACTAALKLKEVFDCYAVNVFNTFKSIGEVMGLVENCIAGHEFCPSCGDDDALTKGRCPYHMSWHLADDDLKSDKINNPFKGISKTTPCLQLNFITKGVLIS